MYTLSVAAPSHSGRAEEQRRLYIWPTGSRVFTSWDFHRTYLLISGLDLHLLRQGEVKMKGKLYSTFF